MRTLALLLTLVFSSLAAAQTAPLPSPAEIRLPDYQMKALLEDMPARDLMLEGDSILWVLGKKSMWRWDLLSRRLRRLGMHGQQIDDKSPLTRLHMDATSLYAASRASLYQLQLGTGKVFRYFMGGNGRTMAFSTTKDDAWIVNERGLFRFDRYGKELSRKGDAPVFEKADRVAFDAESKTMWIARGNKLLRGGDVKLTTKHKLVDVQITANGNEIVAHTAHTVLRLDGKGKVRQQLPVEGKRKLVLMRIDAQKHGYVFDDRLLELFDLKKKSSIRMRLPVREDSKLARLRLGTRTVALAEDGIPKVFSVPDLR